MNTGQSFVDTLKRLCYPDADKLSGSTFDWFFMKKDVVPFLTEFCNLTEANVLTSQELREYASLSAEDLAKIEIFELQSSESKFMEEANDEVQFLKRQLSGLDQCNNSLENQRSNLKDHEKKLLDERDNLEKIFLREKKIFLKLEKEELPEIEKQLTLSFKAIARVAQDINSLLHKATSVDIYYPSKEKFKRDTELYLEKERKLLDFVKFYLGNNLEQFGGLDEKGGDSRKETTSANFQERQMAEVSLLQKVVKITKEKKMRASLEREKLSGELEFYETLKDVNVLQSYELPNYLLQEKIEKVEDALEKYRKLEKDLLSDCEMSISKNVDSHCERIAVTSSVEKIRQYKSCIEKMKAPLDLLLDQKARLEFFMTFLSLQEEKFLGLRDALEQVSKELLQDFIDFNERKAFYEGVIYKDEENEVKYLSSDSVLFQLYCILEDPENVTKMESLKITAEDVLLKIESLRKTDSTMKEHKEEMFNSYFRTLELLEKNVFSLEGIALEKDKWFQDLKEEEHNADVELNQLAIKNSSLTAEFISFRKSYRDKKKLLERNPNLQMARELYVHFLTDREQFDRDIEKIKLKIENSPHYVPPNTSCQE